MCDSELIEPNKKRKPNYPIIDFIYKLTPLLTLIFIIYSYYNSVKPVFDKQQELQNAKNTIEILSAQIESKELSLDDFTHRVDSLRKISNRYSSEINGLNLEKEKLNASLNKYKNDLILQNTKANDAEISAVKVHLRSMAKFIYNKTYETENEKTLNIREYAKIYSQKYQEDNKKDKYAIIASKVFIKYSEFQGGANIEENVFYVTVFYEYNQSHNLLPKPNSNL